MDTVKIFLSMQPFQINLAKITCQRKLTFTEISNQKDQTKKIIKYQITDNYAQLRKENNLRKKLR